MSSTASTDPTDDADQRAARRTLALVAVALLAVLVGVVVVVVTTLTRDDQASTQTIGGPEAVTAVGPPEGVDVASYVGGRAQLPSDLGRARVAVVSFTTYLDPEQALELMPTSADVVGRLVALRGGEPAFITGGLDAWRRRAQADAAAEADEIDALLPTVDDPEFDAFYRRESVRLRGLAADTSDDVVFGVVVVVDGVGLATLVSTPGVRLVDAAAGDRLAATAAVAGLRPEEVTLTGEPPTRP